LHSASAKGSNDVDELAPGIETGRMNENGQGQDYEASAEPTPSEGPLPAPDVLRQYEAILPGSVSRLFDMGEIEGEHRRALEIAEIEAHTKLARRLEV